MLKLPNELFKIRTYEDPNKRVISYIPWNKAELKAIVKYILKATEYPHRFAEEFNIVVQMYQPAFSDLYQFVHMLVGEGQAQLWVKTANWESLEQFL